MKHSKRFRLIWYDMKRRCDNPNNVNYKYYGEKGITYDKRWSDFNNFKMDMFNGYSEILTLDRINPLLNYNKENCRWISKKQQKLNKSQYKTNKLKTSNIFYCVNKGVNTLCCKITINGKSYKKTMSLIKYEFNIAQQSLIEWRDKMFIDLGFYEHHGVSK